MKPSTEDTRRLPGVPDHHPIAGVAGIAAHLEQEIDAASGGRRTLNAEPLEIDKLLHNRDASWHEAR